MTGLSINFDWLSRDVGDSISRITFADISITVDDHVVTELEDLTTKSVRQGVRASAYTLAIWFAANWWRLRWEPLKEDGDWAMSHKVAAAGQGYLWPDLTFDCDGDAMLLRARATPNLKQRELRYLNSFSFYISAKEFERGIDAFIEAVLGRLESFDVRSSELLDIWTEVLNERRDPSLKSLRKLEAILGFDPGDAPDELIEQLQQAGAEYGIGAVEEIAAASGENALDDIYALCNGPRQDAQPVHIPDLDLLVKRIKSDIPGSLFPWQRAASAAAVAREIWSVEEDRVPDSKLTQLFRLSTKVIGEAGASAAGPMSAGYRNGHAGSMHVSLKGTYPASRRFALLRLIGDCLIAPVSDKILPAPQSVRTERQKFQRAFAQEFLCPYSALSARFGSSDYNDDTIDEAADYFGVSPLTIKTVLVNKRTEAGERFEPELRGE